VTIFYAAYAEATALGRCSHEAKAVGQVERQIEACRTEAHRDKLCKESYDPGREASDGFGATAESSSSCLGCYVFAGGPAL
jgi:hypothetical protein